MSRGKRQKCTKNKVCSLFIKYLLLKKLAESKKIAEKFPGDFLVQFRTITAQRGRR